VKKEILASLMSSLPWCQVLSINSWRKDVLSVKKVAWRCRVCAEWQMNTFCWRIPWARTKRVAIAHSF